MGRSKHASSYKWLPRAVMQWSPVLFGGFLVGRGQSRSPELAPHLPMAVFVAISSSRASQAADFSASTIFCSASFWFSSSSWMVASFSLSRPPSRRLHWAEDREHRYSPLRGLCSQHTRLHTTQWDSPSLGSQENQIKSCQASLSTSIAILVVASLNGNPLQYSCLENAMDRGAWQTTVHGVAKQSDVTEWLTTLWLPKWLYFWKQCFIWPTARTRDFFFKVFQQRNASSH